MRLKVTPGMSLAVSLLALVIAMTGTAVAAKSMLTGKDIKNGSITTADIANGAITSKLLAKNSVKTPNLADHAVVGSKINLNTVAKICPGGVVVYNDTCPSEPGAQAAAVIVPFSVAFPAGPGVTCYSEEIAFQNDGGWPSGENQWHSASSPQDLPFRGWSQRVNVSVQFVFGGTAHTTYVGGILHRVSKTGVETSVPDSLLKAPSTNVAETGATLAYTFGDLKAGENVRVEALACSTGDVPFIKSVRASLYGAP